MNNRSVHLHPNPIVDSLWNLNRINIIGRQPPVAAIKIGRGGEIATRGRAQSDRRAKEYICLLYTSDAADERSSVDLGGRRIIKKKKTKK